MIKCDFEGFAMIALVELHYDADTPHWLLIMLGVSWHLLIITSWGQWCHCFFLGGHSSSRFRPSSCSHDIHVHSTVHASSWANPILAPYQIEVSIIYSHVFCFVLYQFGWTNNVVEFRFLIDLSWFFSTCVGLILFLVEIGLIFYIKFRAVGFEQAGWITTAILGEHYLCFSRNYYDINVWDSCKQYLLIHLFQFLCSSFLLLFHASFTEIEHRIQSIEWIERFESCSCFYLKSGKTWCQFIPEFHLMHK